MKIGILSRNAELYSTRRLVEAANQRGHEARVVDYLRCYMNIASHRPGVIYRGEKLHFDAVVPRVGASNTFYGTAVVRQFEMMGVFPANESQAISRSRDKLRSLQLLSREGIGLPVTGFANSTRDIDGLLDIVGGAPVIVKLLEGTQGIGVVLAETRKAAESVIAAFLQLDADILVQEFIKEAKGADIRAFVIDGRVRAAMMRQAAEGEFRSNLHRGGTAEVAKLTPEERSTAVRAAKAMGLNVAGVDMLRSNHGPVVMEVNSSPGLEGIETATGMDLAGQVVEFLEKGRNEERRKIVPKAEDSGLPEIHGVKLPPGERTNIEVDVARLPTGTWISLPVAVLRGRRSGPSVWLSAALHGDELNGIEIVRQVLPQIDLERLRGTVIAAPIVNVFGFLNRDRYLPDRRDLNRCFPGSPKGSLASRLADLFMNEIVDKCEYGIDLHTGSHHRTNLPQIRADLSDAKTRKLTRAFAAPVSIPAKSREGSLRQAATARGRTVLVYEAGETLRFDRNSIRVGVHGVLRVLQAIRMSPTAQVPDAEAPTRFVDKTHWARAPRSGFLLMDVELGETVGRGQVMARVTDTFSEDVREIRSPSRGVVIGLTTNPVANRGDAVIHVADL